MSQAEQVRSWPECSHEPSENDVAAAKGAFEAGNVSFQEADYGRAILYWEDAFRRDCTALGLLKNLARAYELSNKKRDAIAALETYLARRPNDPQRDQITRRIEVLTQQLEQEEAAAAAAAAPPPPPPAATSTTTEPAPETSTSDLDLEAEPEASVPLWPLYVVGAGLVTTVAGMIVYFPAKSDVDDVKKQCPGFKCPNTPEGRRLSEEGNSAQTRRDTGVVLMIAGGVAFLGGGITYLVLGNQAENETVLAPAIAPGFAGLSLSSSF